MFWWWSVTEQSWQLIFTLSVRLKCIRSCRYILITSRRTTTATVNIIVKIRDLTLKVSVDSYSKASFIHESCVNLVISFSFFPLIYSCWSWKIYTISSAVYPSKESVPVIQWCSLGTAKLMSQHHTYFVVPLDVSEVLNCHNKIFSCQVFECQLSHFLWQKLCAFHQSSDRNILWNPIVKSCQSVQNLGEVHIF